MIKTPDVNLSVSRDSSNDHFKSAANLLKDEVKVSSAKSENPEIEISKGVKVELEAKKNKVVQPIDTLAEETKCAEVKQKKTTESDPLVADDLDL